MLQKLLASALLLPFLACSCAGSPGDFPSSCRGLYDAYTTWSSACDRPALNASTRDELVIRCQERAALPGIDVSPATLGACARQVAASSCAALPIACLTRRDAGYPGLPTDVWLGDVSFARYELFPRVTGTLAAGRGCDLDAQCRSARCSGSPATCGVCVDVNGPGEACGATAVCDAGSQCDGGVCVSWGDGPGAACQSVKGTNCARSLRCVDGICVPPHQAGESCAGESASCVDGAVCNNGVCQTIVTASAGENCDKANFCEEGTYCVDGECRGPELDMGLDDRCTIDICSEGLVCSGLDRCVEGAPTGQACSYEVPCAARLVCFNDPGGRVCGAPRTEGGTCDSPTGECATGFFCMGWNPGVTKGVCHRELDAGEPCALGSCRPSLTCTGGVCVALGSCSTP